MVARLFWVIARVFSVVASLFRMVARVLLCSGFGYLPSRFFVDARVFWVIICQGVA